MDGPNPESHRKLTEEQLCNLARNLIQSKVNRLRYSGRITLEDREDFEQEVYLRLIPRIRSASARRCPVQVMIVRIVDQSIANQLRDRNAAKRNRARVEWTETCVQAEDWEQLVELEQRHAGRSPQELADLGMDVEAILAELTNAQRELCRGLGIHSVSELARRFNRPRTTIQSQVSQLRRRFEEKGLEEYL